MLPDEERVGADQEDAYHRLLARLSHQSVVKHYDAYADIPWDDPAYAIDPATPGSRSPSTILSGPRRGTAPAAGDAGAPRAAHVRDLHRIGWSFESILKRGMLEFVSALPDDAPEFRYAYHEIIEEAQHSLIFHEFVRRSGLEVRPPRLLGLGQHRVPRLGRRFPELFFMLVSAARTPSTGSAAPATQRAATAPAASSASAASTSPRKRVTWRSPVTTCAAPCRDFASASCS